MRVPSCGEQCRLCHADIAALRSCSYHVAASRVASCSRGYWEFLQPNSFTARPPSCGAQCYLPRAARPLRCNRQCRLQCEQRRMRRARAAITLRPKALPALHSLRAVVRNVISATLHGLCAVTGGAVCDNAPRSFQEAASNTTCDALHFRLRRTTADCATLRSSPRARDRSMGTISTLPSLR